MIPEELLQKLEKETHVNHQVKKMSGVLTLKLLLFSLLNSERVSLRVMEEIFNSDQFKVFSQKGNQKTKHSTIGDRVANINSDFFEKIFLELCEKFQPLAKNKKVSKKLNDICIHDSTMVSVSAKLLRMGIASGSDCKRQIKFTVGLQNSLPKNVVLFKEQSDISEDIALKKSILEANYSPKSIVLFDRGLQKKKTLIEFSDKNILFVTRLRTNALYRETKQFKEINGRKTDTLLLKKDILIELISKNKKIPKNEFRLVIATSLKTQETFLFLTNILDLNAREITDLYKKRWEIEVFFKFLKQELNFKHFVSRTENGIRVMMYATLILALLILIYKEKNNISSYKIAKIRFTNELDMEITKEIVLACDGSISKFNKWKKSHHT
jgi:hypothetical protein